MTDSNVKEAREIDYYIKQISVSISGDTNIGKKGISTEIHDLKERYMATMKNVYKYGSMRVKTKLIGK